MNPLTLSRWLKPAKEPGISSRLRNFIGLWQLSGFVEKEIKSQLKMRNEQDSEDAWKNSDIPKYIRENVSGIVREYKYWPNTYYIPEDPCACLLTMYCDDLEINEIIRELENSYGINFDCLYDIPEDATYEDFLRLVIQQFR